MILGEGSRPTNPVNLQYLVRVHVLESARGIRDQIEGSQVTAPSLKDARWLPTLNNTDLTNA